VACGLRSALAAAPAQYSTEMSRRTHSASSAAYIGVIEHTKKKCAAQHWDVPPHARLQQRDCTEYVAGSGSRGWVWEPDGLHPLLSGAWGVVRTACVTTYWQAS